MNLSHKLGPENGAQVHFRFSCPLIAFLWGRKQGKTSVPGDVEATFTVM